MDEVAIGMAEELFVKLTSPVIQVRASVANTVEITWITETGEVLRVQQVTFE